MEEVGARVSLKNARKAQQDAKGVSKEIAGMGTAAQQASRRMTAIGTASRGMGAGLLGVGRTAAYAAAGGAALGVAFGVKTYRAFDESRKIAAQTNAVIKATGGAAKVSADDVSALSQSLSERTGVDDELIQSGSNLLLTFKRIRNEAGKGNKVFDRATAAAVDLSAAGFGSLDSTSKQLGKALNDPVKGITALNRAGVTFTQGQKDQIKAMTESGNLLGAQKIILREVESQVGGSAEAQATSLDKLKVAWGNIEEAIGSGVAPAVDAISADLTDLARDALPSVEKAAARVGGIFRSDELDWVSKLKFSGRAVGQELGPEIAPLVDILEAEVGKLDAGAAIGGAIEKGAPVMADALAAQVPRMASAFVTAFREAGPGGQLLTVALLAAKFGAFRGAGAAAAGMFTSSFRTSATTSGVFSQVGRSGGAKVGSGIVLHGGNEVANGAKGGKLDAAGRAMGTALSAAAVLMLVPAIRDALIAEFPDLARYSGSDGWGNLADDLGITGNGPSNSTAGTSRNERPATPQQRRDAGVPPGASMDAPPPRADPTNPLVPQGPLTTRGANFRLPDPGIRRGESLTLAGPLVLQLKDGTKLHEENVKIEARRERRR